MLLLLLLLIPLEGVIPAVWEKFHKSNPHSPQPYYSPWYQTFKFIFRFKNLIDLASILPSYVNYFVAKVGQ